MRVINGCSNYLINNDGSVFSKISNKFLCLTPDEKANGYIRVTLKLDDNTKKKYLVHRLVAEAYIPNPENKPEVNHIDGNKLNNHVSNLEWVTRHENMLHAHTMKLRDNNGEGNPRNILEEYEVLEIYKNLLNGVPVSYLAEKYCVSCPTIADIKSKRNWGYLLNDLPNIQHKPKRDPIPLDMVEDICERIANGLGITEIVNILKHPSINCSSVHDIKRKKTFKHISDKYF